jgi:pheromone shutdown protein TraB
MTKEIYLCGTNHLDFKGPKKIKEILKKIKPEIIGLEYTKKDYNDIIKNHNIWVKDMKKLQKGSEKIAKKKTSKKLVRDVFSTAGYEAWVSYDYSKENRVKIIFLEDEKISKPIEKYVLKSIGKKGIVEFIKDLSLPEKKFNKKIKEVKGNRKISKWMKLTERNKIFSKKIGKLDGKILILCGEKHINGEKPTLKDLLKEDNPKILKI